VSSEIMSGILGKLLAYNVSMVGENCKPPTEKMVATETTYSKD